MRNLFIVIFISLHLNTYAQKSTLSIQYKNTPLNEVLNALETTFVVKFAYNATDIKNQSIDLRLNRGSLNQIIARIEKDYPVIFKQIDPEFYSVKTVQNLRFCGYLKDGIDGSPIQDASVINQEKTQGTTSDEKGYFSLNNCSPTDTLSVSFLGFKTLLIPLKNSRNKNCNTYTLLSDNYALNEVVIQEYLTAGVVKTKDGAVRFSPNSVAVLAGLPEPDILQNIQLLPGIESPSETAAGLYIRGGSPDQNLILWDGIKMYNSNHFFGMLSAFNPYITNNIKIYRSGAKPEYGDRISGIIDIKTDAEIPTKLQGGIGVNMTHADAYLKFPLSKKLGILVSARRSLTDILETPTFNKFADKIFQNTSISASHDEYTTDISEENGRFYFTDLSFKIMSPVSEKDYISISGIFTKNKLDYEFNLEGFEQGSSDYLNVDNKGMSVLWKREWQPKFSSKTEFYYTAYNFSYDGLNPFLEETQTITKRNSIEEIGFKFHSDLVLNNSFTFSNGYQLLANEVSYVLKEIDFTAIDHQKATTHTLYTGLNYNKQDRWYVDLAMRADYATSFNTIYIEPRIYAERILSDAFRFKGSAEIRNQSISQIIEFTTVDFGLENQIWTLAHKTGSPLLRSDQVTLGFIYNKNGWKLDADFYYKNIDGFTSFTNGFESTDENESLFEGTNEIKGIDILLKKKINNYVSWIGYTYATNNYTFDDINQGNEFRGNNDITHSLTWSHSLRLSNFQFSLGWKYRTGTPYTKAVGIITENNEYEVNYATINAATLPDYHRLDFSLLYDFEFSKKRNAVKGKIGLSVLNIYNQKNTLGKGFTIHENTDTEYNTTATLRTVTKYSLGMTPNLFFRVRF